MMKCSSFRRTTITINDKQYDAWSMANQIILFEIDLFTLDKYKYAYAQPFDCNSKMLIILLVHDTLNGIAHSYLCMKSIILRFTRTEMVPLRLFKITISMEMINSFGCYLCERVCVMRQPKIHLAIFI